MASLNSTIEAGDIIKYLYSNYCSKNTCEGGVPVHPTNKKWSIADLFIRQFLNNGCDGFGLKNVDKVYFYLLQQKSLLIKHSLISKNGYNNSGWPLWKDYNFESKNCAALYTEAKKEKNNEPDD